MRRCRSRRTAKGIVAGIIVIALSAAILAKSDCWCAQFVDLQDEVSTRNASVFFRIAASVGLTGAAYWAADALGLPNPQWYKVGALVSGIANTASALADLMLPTQRAIERDAERIAESTLSEELCADTLSAYAGSVRAHRFVEGLVRMGSGAAQLLLLSPYGTYATGDIYDYVFLVTGGIDIVAGLINVIFPTRFERDYDDAVGACGH